MEIYGIDHTNVAFKSYNLAKAYLGLKQYEKAQPLIEQAVRIFLSKFGEKDYRLALVRQGLAECLFNQGKHTVALPIIDKSLTVLNDFFGVDHSRTKKAQLTKDEITDALSKG